MGLTDWIPSALKPAVAEDGSPERENGNSNGLTKSESSASAKGLTSLGGASRSNSSSQLGASSSSTTLQEPSPEEARSMSLISASDPTSSADSYSEMPSKRPSGIRFANMPGSSFAGTGRGAQRLRSRTFTQGIDTSWSASSQSSPEYTGHDFADFSAISAAGLKTCSPNFAQAPASILTPSDPSIRNSISRPLTPLAEPKRVLRVTNPDDVPVNELGIAGVGCPSDMIPKIPQNPYWATGPVSPEEFNQYKEGMEGCLRDVSTRLVETQQQLREQGQAHEIDKLELQRQINDLTKTNQQLTQSALTKDEERESQLHIDTTDTEDFIEDYKNEEPRRSLSDQILELHIQVLLTRGEASRMAEDYAAMESHAEYAAQLASELIDPKAMIAHCDYHRGIALYYQRKWSLASDAFQASKGCEGVWKTASEINNWIQKVAIKTEATDGLSAVSRFSAPPFSASSGIFGRFGWENLGGLSSAVARPSATTPSALSGLFGKFGWENLGGFSALGTPKTPFGSAVATTWGTSPSGQPHLPLESSEASFCPEPDSPGSLKSRTSRQKGHSRSTSDISFTSGEGSDRGPTPRPGSRTSHSPSIARPPSPLRIQKSDNRSPSSEASFETNPSGQPILPLSDQEFSRRVVNPASTTSEFSSGVTNAQDSKRARGDLPTALRNLKPLEIPSSSRSSSLMASNSNDYRKEISSPDRGPLILLPGVPYPEFPDSSSSEASQQPQMPIVPRHTQPLRVINRSPITPEASSSSAAASSDLSAVTDSKPAFPDHTGPLRVVAPPTPKASSASTRSSSPVSSRLLGFPDCVTPPRTMNSESQPPQMSSSSPKELWGEGEPRRLESTNTASAPEAKPENDETERSVDHLEFEEQEVDKKAAEVVRKVMGTGAEGSSADWGSNEEQALTDYLVGGDGDAGIKDEGRDENGIESEYGDKDNAKARR